MTVITWRNGYMACDSCWDYAGTQVVSAIKMVRLSSGALLGSAGDNDNRAIVELLDKIKDPKKLPSRAQIAETKVEFMGLLAFPKGGVWCISSAATDENGWVGRDSYKDGAEDDAGVWPATTMGGYAAVGSGSDYALAAMDAHPSVSAARAVEVACRRAAGGVRPPVWSWKLHPLDSKARIVVR